MSEVKKHLFQKHELPSSTRPWKTCHHIALWALWAHTEDLGSGQTEIKGGASDRERQHRSVTGREEGSSGWAPVPCLLTGMALA